MPPSMRDRAGNVKAADADLNAARAQGPRDIERAGKLVGLHADQHHHAHVGGFDQARDFLGADLRVGLVERMDVEFDIGAEHAAVRAIGRQAIDRGQRIRRDRRAIPLNDIALVVVMRRLDQNQTEIGVWTLRLPCAPNRVEI